MKPTQYFSIIIPLLFTFSCDDNDLQISDDEENIISIDWILLKKGVSVDFYLESCDGYIENSGDEYVGYNCWCNEELNNECGNCKLETSYDIRVDSCDGFEFCNDKQYHYNVNQIIWDLTEYECCYEWDYSILDEDGNETDETEKRYYRRNFPFYEYKLYWNDDIEVCVECILSWDEEILNKYDIIIPSFIPILNTYDCENNVCESGSYFHPNCDTPLDTTLNWIGKNVDIEKMGWLDRGDDNDRGYIIYLIKENYLQTNIDDIDISDWKVVDYQIKE